MATAQFLTHARYFELLVELTGRKNLKPQSIPAGVLRALGHVGDLAQRWLGKSTQLTSETALVLTRSVPADDREARAPLGRDPIPIEHSLRDTIAWMAEAGVLTARQAGRLSPSGSCRDADPVRVEGLDRVDFGHSAEMMESCKGFADLEAGYAVPGR